MIVKPNLAIFLLAGAVALGTACGDDDPPVKLNDDLAIISFDVNPKAVIPGDQVTITWETKAATSIRILGSGGVELNVAGQSPASGSITDTPSANTTYRLIASSAANVAEKKVDVTIRSDQPTVTLEAEKRLLDVGESTVLSWKTTNATRVSMKADGAIVDVGNKLEGTLAITPSRTTTYELTAIGAGTAADSVEVEVAPIVEIFEVVLPDGSSGRFEPRSRAELRWKTVGADDLVLTGGPGFSADPILPNQRNEGTRRFTVPEDGKVTLTATRGPTQVTRELPLVLRGAPVIVRAAAVPNVITVGEKTDVRFEWVVEDVESIELSANPGGKIPTFGKNIAHDFVELKDLTSSALLSFTAANKVGSTTADVVVRAVPHATITSFQALPSRVNANEDVQLAWNVSGASLVELFRGDTKLDIDGTKATGTTTDRVTADTVYRLRAVNEAGGESVSTVQVTIGAPVIDTFATVQGNVVPGSRFDLAWTARGGRTLEVKGPGGAIAACATSSLTQIAAGGCQVTAPATPGDATYELTVNGSGGAKATKTLTVAVSDGPWIKSLTVSEERASVGGTVTLAWTVENDTQNRQPTLRLVDDLGAEISLAGRNPNFGSVVVPLTAAGSRQYTLTAETPGTRVSTAKVSVSVIPLATISLAATPSPFNPAAGVPLKLSWDTSGAESIELFVLDTDGTPRSLFKLTSSSTPDAPARIAHGEYVLPNPPPFRTPVVYRARVLNELFAANTAEVTLPVLMPTITSFTASPRAQDGTVTLNWNTSGGNVSIVSIASNCPATGCPFVEVSTSAPYVDIHAQGGATSVPLTQCGSTLAAGEDGCGDFPLGFNFSFEGDRYGSVRAFVNGFLSVDVGSFPPAAGQNSGFAINSSKRYVNIAPYWANLKLGAAPSGLYYETRNDPSWGDYTVVQWKGLLPASGSNTHDFEVVLFQNGSYDLRYGNMSSLNTGTRGWQGASSTNAYSMPAAKITEGGGTSNNRSFRRVVNAPSLGSLQVDARVATTFKLTVESPAGTPSQQVSVPAP